VFGGDTFAAEGVGDHQFALNYTSADDKFIPTLGITLKYGQNFREDSPSDSMQVILNESAIAKIGWPLDESVIGRRLRYPNSGDPSLTFEVIGVVEDFNYWSIATPIEPMAIFHNSNRYVGDSGKNFVVIRIEPQNPEAWESTFADLRALWKRHADTLPLEYSFIDANFARTFATHQQFGNVLSVLAALAIIIASLGLLGMIVYSLEQRTKEIGIRKVAGACQADPDCLPDRCTVVLVHDEVVASRLCIFHHPIGLDISRMRIRHVSTFLCNHQLSLHQSRNNKSRRRTERRVKEDVFKC
jgi:putative ABC transport system permease protein